MIVASFFEDDEDQEVAWKQHEVYGDALGIIVGTCNRHALFARAVLHDSKHDDWGTVVRFDHRTIQNAHDLLAAAWRFENDLRQPKLPFEPENPLDHVQALWLEWLRKETEKWITAPWIVRSVQVILTNQNQPLGYKAEGQLCLDILDRFPDVPWKPHLRAAHETDPESG